MEPGQCDQHANCPKLDFRQGRQVSLLRYVQTGAGYLRPISRLRIGAAIPVCALGRACAQARERVHARACM
jgi:hypothetical protein